MRQFIIVICFLTLSLPCLTQVDLDSLWSVWNDESQADTNRLEAMNKIAWNVRNSNLDSAFNLAQMEYELAERIGNKKMMANALNTQGSSLFRKGDYEKALDYHSHSLKIKEEIGNKYGVAASLSNIGVVYSYQGNKAKAIEYFTRSLKIGEEIGNKRGIAVSLLNIGGIYAEQGEYTKAMDYFSRSLKIREEIGDKRGFAASLTNIGNLYKDQGNTAKAMDYYSRSLKIDEEIGNKNGIAYSLINIGGIYQDKGEYAKAMSFYTRSLKIREEIGDKRGISASLMAIGQIHFKKSEFTKAISYSIRAFVLAQEIGNTDMIKRVSESLYESYKATGQSQKALEMHELYITMKDSILSEENERAVIHQEYKYNYEKDKMADSLAQKESSLQAELEHQTQLSKKDQTRNILIGSGFLVLLLAGGLYSRVQYIRKSNARLEVEKENAEFEKNRAERSEHFKSQFLANMSHEIRTPMNAVLGMTELTLDTELNEKQEKYLSAVKKSSENLLVIINDILDLSKLEAGKMELEQIPFKISEQIEQVHDTLRFKAEEKGLVFESKIDKDVPEVVVGDPSRLNQVLINLCGNAIKFTEKGRVSLSVGVSPGSDGKLIFKVKDTGIGIPKDKVGTLFSAFQQVEAGTSRKYGGTGLGLSISQTLVELQGGKIKIKSEEGKGSEFSFSIPYTKASGNIQRLLPLLHDNTRRPRSSLST